MINFTKISTCFQGLVGFRESAKAGSCYDDLSDALKQSDSGLYVNDVEGVSLEIINDIKGQDFATVNDYLDSKFDSGLRTLINDFVIKQKKENYAKSLLKNQDIGIKPATNIRDYSPKNNRFVGFEIRPKKSNSIRTEILQFGGMFSQIQNELPIYFYSSFQLDPIDIYYANIDKTNSLVWFTLDETQGSDSGTHIDPLTFICDYINDNSGHGQRYWIGYYESDLDTNNYAVYTKTPCYTCNYSNAYNHLEYVDVIPCEVPTEHTYVSRELFDIDNIGYADSTYGLFVKLNVTCDISQVLCDNKNLFASSLQKKIASKILWDAYNAPASAFNANSTTKKSDFRLMAEKLEFELNGGIVDGRYQKGELETLSIDFSNIDQVCLGMRKRAFGVFQL